MKILCEHKFAKIIKAAAEQTLPLVQLRRKADTTQTLYSNICVKHGGHGVKLVDLRLVHFMTRRLPCVGKHGNESTTVLLSMRGY